MNKLTIDELIEQIKGMKVTELNELVVAIEKTFNVSAQAAVSVDKKEDKQEILEGTVLLKDIGSNKIAVIKVVRELTSLGLMDAKKLVESTPCTIKEKVKKDDATAMIEKFKTAGALAEFK